MLTKTILATTLLLGTSYSAVAQEETPSKPAALEFLQGSLGVWDAEMEVWPGGPDADSIKFKGVETNRAYGEYWMASDFDSEVQGQTMRLHTIIGYDLEKKALVGTIIDQGPYAASMTGEYDAATKTVRWETQARAADGTPMLQKTTMTQESPDERVLVLTVPGPEDTPTKFMQINFTKRP